MSEQVLRELMERLTCLEAEVQRIKDVVRGEQKAAEKPWWEKIAGSHKDDEVFAEIARLGAEIRRAERPTARKEEAKKETPKKARHRAQVKPSVRE